MWALAFWDLSYIYFRPNNILQVNPFNSALFFIELDWFIYQYSSLSSPCSAELQSYTKLPCLKPWPALSLPVQGAPWSKGQYNLSYRKVTSWPWISVISVRLICMKIPDDHTGINGMYQEITLSFVGHYASLKACQVCQSNSQGFKNVWPDLKCIVSTRTFMEFKNPRHALVVLCLKATDSTMEMYGILMHAPVEPQALIK